MSSAAEEVIADQSLEEWTLLGQEEDEEEQVRGTAKFHPSPVSDLLHSQYLPHAGEHTAGPPDPPSASSSDMEVVEHDSDDDVVQESSGSVSMLLRDRTARAMDWSFSDSDATLDLTPGPRAYIHHPNDSVNFWLNLSLLVAVTSVLGMGLGNYIGSYVNWPRQAMDPQPLPSHLKHLQQQLDDCLHEKELLLNSTALYDMLPSVGRDYSTSFPVGPETEEQVRADSVNLVPRQSSDAAPAIIPQTRETHPRHSKVPAVSQQVIIRKTSVICELTLFAFSVSLIHCFCSKLQNQ